jgi:acyclic terpene utilization AtuA family protein
MTEGKKRIRIGGASGYWGDAGLATAQLLAGGAVDYLVYDYLAEITMGILARMRARNADKGYATDFLTEAMGPNLPEIARQGVKVISNAGGVNPLACAAALRAGIARQGLSLTVASVCGDDLSDRIEELTAAGHNDMFSGAPFPSPEKIASVNAYLGAFPIAEALKGGADIVVTGRCVDSAVTLAACIHAFGWLPEDFDRLAAGSLAGHLLECGAQATGGNFTDWRSVAGEIDDIGYPIAEVAGDGPITMTKPEGSGGLVCPASVGEQLVYEIADPQNYLLPDVTCDFSEVTLRQSGLDRVAVCGVKGRAPTASYKTCLIWQNGWRAGHLFGYYGLEAEEKAGAFAKAALRRARVQLGQQGLIDFTETSVEILGSEAQFGTARQSMPAREVNVKIAVRHEDARGVGVFLKAATGIGLASPPGLSGFAGARPKPSPVMALFSFLLPKHQVTIRIHDAAGERAYKPVALPPAAAMPPPHAPPKAPEITGQTIRVPLIRLAYARSGDKGDSANIGVIARNAEFLPFIWHALCEQRVREVFSHFLQGEVERYLLPGMNAMNIVLSRVLGGGGMSSLRNDPQGKGYAQLLLASEIEVPKNLPEAE